MNTFPLSQYGSLYCYYRSSAAPGATVTTLLVVPPFDRPDSFEHLHLRTLFPIEPLLSHISTGQTLRSLFEAPSTCVKTSYYTKAACGTTLTLSWITPDTHRPDVSGIHAYTHNEQATPGREGPAFCIRKGTSATSPTTPDAFVRPGSLCSGATSPPARRQSVSTEWATQQTHLDRQ